MSWAISDRARRVWDEWNIRAAVISSLCFQVVLIVLANSRRRKGSKLLTAIIWFFYLLADWIAAFAVGLISSGQSSDDDELAVNKKLAVFWAPFLLLHLGGPDAITAFSLEDNELWIRHLLGLVIQLFSVVYVFFQSLPNDYWIPTLLIFLAGAAKYVERTVSMYQACLGNFKRALLSKPDAGPNYARLMAEFSALQASGVPVEIIVENEPEKGGGGGSNSDDHDGQQISNNEPDHYYWKIRTGYEFFDTFKGLIVDHMFSFHERDKSRGFFLGAEAVEAFQIIEVELNFLYDVLYTKMGVVHHKRGYLCRLVCTALIVVCFQQFVMLPQHNVHLLDKILSYVLLGGAIVLEMVALFNLVFSDWAVVKSKRLSRILDKIPLCKRKQRWSNSMFQHSFISFCLREERSRWLHKVVDFFRVNDILEEFINKEEIGCGDELKKFVFKELSAKAEKAVEAEKAKKTTKEANEIYSARGKAEKAIKTTKEAKEIYFARGNYVLNDSPSHYFHQSIRDSVSDETEYDESLLLWHIATELCYFTSSDTTNTDRDFCKILSDYMLYLLVMQPTLMSTVAGIAQIRYQDTCEEAKTFCKQLLSNRLISSTDAKKEMVLRSEMVCRKLLEVKTEVKPIQVKGDRSKSLLFDACILANHLRNMRGQWEIMKRIWVELLSYGASRCRPSDHARQLTQGGEFITFVWLLMVHFGLGEQFRIQSGHARAKLLVSK